MRHKATNAKPSERGLGPNGGGWNIEQAAAWSGIGSASLRAMAKQSVETKDPTLFPCILVGQRRMLIPREGFIAWFNRREVSAALNANPSSAIRTNPANAIYAAQLRGDIRHLERVAKSLTDQITKMKATVNAWRV